MSSQEVATPGAAEEILTRPGDVVQLFRRPGLSQSATKTLLRKVWCCDLQHVNKSGPACTRVHVWAKAA